MDSHTVLYNQKRSLLIIGKKNTTFTKFVINLWEKSFQSDEHICFLIFTDLLSLIICNSRIIKANSLNVFNYTSAEKLSDVIYVLIKKHHALNMLKSILSKKYNHLITPESVNLFVEISEMDISKADLQIILGKKLATYKTPESFCVAIQKIINNSYDFSMTNILNVIKEKNLNVDIISSCIEKNQLILLINDYYSSSILGSHHWCISYNESYFNQYTKDLKANSMFSKLGSLYKQTSKSQYFIFNFNLSNNKSIIGVTLNNSQVTAAHLKNDDCYLNRPNNFHLDFLVDMHKNTAKETYNTLKIQKRIESLKGDTDYLHLLSFFFLDEYKGSKFISDYIVDTFKEAVENDRDYEYLEKLAVYFSSFEVEFDENVLFKIIENSGLKRNIKMKLESLILKDIDLFFHNYYYLKGKNLIYTKNINLWILILTEFFFNGSYIKNEYNYEKFKNNIVKIFPDYKEQKLLETVLVAIKNTNFAF
jgi:hypothetical protein